MQPRHVPKYHLEFQFDIKKKASNSALCACELPGCNFFYRQLGSSCSVATTVIKFSYPEELFHYPQTLHIYTYGHYGV